MKIWVFIVLGKRTNIDRDYMKQCIIRKAEYLFDRTG